MYRSALPGLRIPVKSAATSLKASTIPMLFSVNKYLRPQSRDTQNRDII
jgi:hypothetical protein